MDLTVFESDEPRIHDLRLAERLGFANPRQIRELIKRNAGELERYGSLSCHTTNDTGGRPATEYWLNEGQAILICLKSGTPRAADCREELIILFKTWRQGKLAPLSAGDITLAAIGEVVRREIDPIRREVAEVCGNVAFLARRVDDIVPRRDFPKEVRQQFCHVALRRYNRDCPCCRDTKVVDENGNAFSGAHHEHFNGRELNKAEHGWITCAKCNYRLLNDAEFKEASRAHFRVFQDYRRQLFAGKAIAARSKYRGDGQGELAV